LLWVLALLFFSDLAMPLSPGAFQFEPGQSLEVARRVSVQRAAAQLPPLPHRFPASGQPAPRPMEHAAAPRREAMPTRIVVPFRNPRDESEALTSEADPPLPA
jgi:hypothetical protein